MPSIIDGFTCAGPERVWPLREIVAHNGIGGRGSLFAGPPADIAGEMEARVSKAGMDGFSLSRAFVPDTCAGAAEPAVPELRRRGIGKQDHAPGTLRRAPRAPSSPARTG